MTVSLRKLVREPLRVKRWTQAGKPVLVTDDGQSLWVLRSAATSDKRHRHREAIDDLLDDVLREPRSKVSAAILLSESRR